jgi:enoyl-CoA hydratase
LRSSLYLTGERAKAHRGRRGRASRARIAPPEKEVPMERLETLTYEVDGRIARVTLNRPERGNGITLEMPRELADCVERANLDPAVHVVALSGNGNGFCGGYDLVASAEAMGGRRAASDPAAPGREAEDAAGIGSPLDPEVIAANHDPGGTWDPVVDFQMMSRNVRGFMSLFHSEKPVLCKVHGFCVAGGTDMALCSDLLVIEDRAKIGYPPARVWGVPTTAVWAYRIGPERAKRLLFTGDSLSGTEAVEWGLATEAAPAERLDGHFEALVERVARLPVNQLVMMKLLVNQTLYAQGLHATQILGTVFDGVARHTPEGFAFQRRAAEAGFKQAVRERDEPFGDFGLAR